LTVFQLFCDGTWAGDADDIRDARRAAETMIGEGAADEVGIEVDGLRLETARWEEIEYPPAEGQIVWQTSDLVRKYDGRGAR
jgi:hypothetical protein